ncbi:MAG TPA: molecular chaperone DnaJ [Acidimicrobiales bacterium]|nr:molecular chaperone DnaJ [Acidimicrobiales bacterium]
MAEDYYALLGVSSSATEDDIKKAYRRRARELHPDTNSDPAAEERFKSVTLAYETLRDAERRRRYDMFGPEGVRGSGAAGTGASGGGAGGFGEGFGGGLGDLFETFFGGTGGFAGGRRGSGPPRGSDMETAVEIDFKGATFGTETQVRARLPVTCETCSGSGARAGTQPQTCRACGGAGEVRQVRQSILGQMVTSSPCRRCGGTGQTIADPCPTCRGEGRVTKEQTFTVDVPAGVDNGSTLRVPGRGSAGPRGGQPGDLYVHLRVKPDSRFTRQGYDLVHMLHLPVTQAALGAHLRYETFDGTEDLVVPRGTQNGRVFRLRGRGVPHVDGRGRGDLLVQVVVDTPDDLTREQEELLRRLAAERGDEVAPPDSSAWARIRSAFK